MRHIFTLTLVILAGPYACEHVSEPFSRSVHGIDVSHYQSVIDWDLLLDQGIDFSFIKATEGVSLSDTMFCQNWDAARKAGLLRGAYHFFRPSYSAHAQADHFIHQVEMAPGDLPPVLDVEVLDGVSRVELLKGMYIWLFRVEIAYGVKPIIYTNQKFYNRYLVGHFEEYPLWIARYNMFPPRLASSSDWVFWQYSERSKLKGIQGPVDVNVFRGDLHALEEMTLQANPILSFVD